MALLAPSAALGQGSFDLPACSIPPICPAFRTGNILANGSVTATKFIGDCSQCTGGGGSGVSQIVAGTNITISPPGGTGAVTVNSTGGGGETAFFAGSKTFGYGIPGSSVTINTSIAAVAALTVSNTGVNSVGASITGSVTGAIVSGGTTGLSATATTVNGTAFTGIGAGNNVVPIFADFVGVHTSNAPLLYGLDEGNTTRTGDLVNFSANSNGLGTFVGNLMNFEVAGISQFVVTSSGGVQATAATLQDSNPLDSFIFKVSTPTSANYVLVSTFGYISLGSSGTLVTDGWDWTMKGGIAPLNALGSGNSAGGFLSFTAGKGLGQAAFGAAGGAISMTGGSGGSNDGPGGVVSIAAGASGPTNNGNANGGALNLSAGAGTSTGGSVNVAAGNGANSTGGSVNLSVGSGPSQPGSINLNGGGPGIQTSLRSDGHLSYNTGGGAPGEVTITGFGAAVPINPVSGDPEHYVLVVSTGDASNVNKWALSVATNGSVAIGVFDPISTRARLTVASNSSNPAMVVASGNVGIGTSSPASRLHISSGTLIIDGNANPRIIITAPLGSGTTVLDATGGIIVASTFNVVGSDYEVDGKTVIDHDGNFKATGTGKTVIDGDGNIKSGGGDTIVDKDGNVSAVGLTIGGVAGLSGSGTSGYIPKWTGTTSLGNTASPIFENSGRIGIGTTNPAYLLETRQDQNGTTAISIRNGTNGAASQSALYAINANGDSIATQITPSGHTPQFGWDTAQTGVVEATGPGGLSLVSLSVTSPIRMYTGGAFERMRIDQTGLVGIGTTAPAAPFVVNGGAQPDFTPTSDFYTTSGNTLAVLRSVNPGQSGIIFSTSTSLPFDTSIYAGMFYKPSSPKMDIDLSLLSGAIPRIEFNGSGNPQIVLTADKNTGSAVNVTVSTDIVTFANGHTEYTGTAPALTSCGTGTSISGNDNIGVITTGALATACTLAFVQNWTNKPICRITDATTNATLAAQTAQSKSQITFTASAATSYNYDCKGYR